MNQVASQKPQSSIPETTSLVDFETDLENVYPIMKVDIAEHMHSRAPIIQLGEDLYACRTWSDYDCNKIKYNHGYAILLKNCNGWGCSLCTSNAAPSQQKCIHSELLRRTESTRSFYNLQAECDGNIFKPLPKKRNVFIHLSWETPVPKAATIYLKNLTSTTRPTTAICEEHSKMQCEDLNAFIKSKFKVTTTLLIQSKKQNSTLSSNSINEPECVSISKKTIFLPYTPAQRRRNRELFLSRPVDGQERELIEDYDEHARCKHGNPFMPGEPRDSWLVKDRNKNRTTLVTTYGTEYVNVYFRPTVGNQCDCKQIYDGNKDGIIYTRDNYLFQHGFLTEIILSLQFETCSVFSHVRSINTNRLLNYGAFTVNPQWTQEAYTAFVKLAKPRNGIELFRCIKCENSQRQVIACDGIQLGSSM